MRIIVTGATSFIGSACVRALLEEGHEVTALIRPGSVKRDRLPGGDRLRILERELNDIGGLKPCETGAADGWMHFGWGGSGSDARRAVFLQEANASCALAALETAASLGCRRFVFSGSQAEYGIRSSLMSEEDVCHPVSEYGKAKARVCREASVRAGELGIEYVHARIFSVYGPGDHPWSLVRTCLDTFEHGGRMELGACTQLWNFLYISDAARAMTLLMTGSAPAGIYNVAGEDTRPLKEYIGQMHRLCGAKGTLLYGKRPPNAEGDTSLIPDVSKLKAAIGFAQSVSFEEGIGSMLRQMRRL